MCIVQCLGEDVCNLKVCLNILDGYGIITYEGSEVVIFQRNMFGSWSYLWRFNQIDAAFIIFEYSAMDSGNVIGEG